MVNAEIANAISDMTMQNVEIPSPGDSLRVKTLGRFKSPFDKAYIIGEYLGEGRFGVVHDTTHVIQRQEVFAVKVERRQEKKEDEKAAIEEVRILRYLQNVPNVIPLVDFYLDAKYMYTVTALCKRGDVLDRLMVKEVYLEFEARELARNFLTIMRDVHAVGVVHRDLKPGNILLKSDHNDTDIYLCDLGYAKQIPDVGNDDYTRLVTVCGTPEYMSPDVLEGSKYSGKKADMWSLGCCIYVLMCGWFPFGEDRTGDLLDRICTGDFAFDDEIWDDVSDGAFELITNLLQVDPNKRWTAERALKCKWFKKQRRKSKSIDAIASPTSVMSCVPTQKGPSLGRLSPMRKNGPTLSHILKHRGL